MKNLHFRIRLGSKAADNLPLVSRWKDGYWLTHHWTFGLLSAGNNVLSRHCFSESGLMEKFVSSQPLDSTTGPVILQYLCPSIEAHFQYHKRGAKRESCSSKS